MVRAQAASRHCMGVLGDGCIEGGPASSEEGRGCILSQATERKQASDGTVRMPSLSPPLGDPRNLPL